MNTTTTAEPQQQTEMQIEEAHSKGDVAIFQPPRLPWHDAFQERFGVQRSQWKALVEAVYPAARTVDAIAMALSYCQARKLDPFKRPVHIVPMWDSKRGGYVETVWPGISELRTTAARTDSYAGCDDATFGPMTKKSFSGKVKIKGNWEDKTLEVEFPEWCRMTLYRIVKGVRCPFAGPKVKWIEAYAGIGNTDIPNDMWQSRPEGQLEKCAEAAALRRAFPEEIGNEYAAEEMEGRKKLDDIMISAKDVTPAATTGSAAPITPRDAGPPAMDMDAPAKTAPAATVEQQKATPPTEPKRDAGPPALNGEVIAPDGKEVKPLEINLTAAPDKDNPSTNPAGFIVWVDRYLGGIETKTDLEAAIMTNVDPGVDELPDGYSQVAWQIIIKHQMRFE